MENRISFSSDTLQTFISTCLVNCKRNFFLIEGIRYEGLAFEGSRSRKKVQVFTLSGSLDFHRISNGGVAFIFNIRSCFANIYQENLALRWKWSEIFGRIETF